MFPIGKIAASVVTATNENNLAGINFQADFSLIRIEAPREYSGLRTALSHLRLENAEQGPLHRTARKLGSLFEQILPSVPKLIEAYGQRVSEISTSAKINQKGSAKDGPFASHVGVDGTSIYAAATSGSSAVAVHLLACMLARTWSGPEAVAIWVELVTERKKFIEESTDFSQISGIAARIAAQQEITRAELANWDASARAWLLSADEVKKFEHTQLKLIIKDTGMLVSSSGSTYTAVVEAWTLAMSSLQKVLTGMPQSISKGALLVGMSSWHIYPDLNIVGPTANVQFKDPPISPGGAITIGLQRTEPYDNEGVQWSLSLSHLRYYGDPVAVSTTAAGLRVSIGELHLISLGSVLGAWSINREDTKTAAEWFAAIWDCVNSDLDDAEKGLSWLYPLANAARCFLAASTKTDKDNAISLIAYGRRKAPLFLCDQDQGPDIMFGLANPLLMFDLSNRVSSADINADEEPGIIRLRCLAEQCGLRTNECLIRYRHQVDNVLNTDAPFGTIYDYATAVPRLRYTKKRDQDGQELATLGHTRWVQYGIDSLKLQALNQTGEVCYLLKNGDMATVPEEDTREGFLCKGFPKDFTKDPSWLTQKPGTTSTFCLPTRKAPSLAQYRFLAGDPRTAALFISEGNRTTDELLSNALPPLELAEQVSLLRSNRIISLHLRRYLKKYGHYDQDTPKSLPWVKSLIALSLATRVYSHLPGATVSLAVTKRTLSQSKWFISSHSSSDCFDHINFLRVHLFRSALFACIAMFESGTLDIEPSSLGSVMALSSGNSIYVANALLQDPLDLDRIGTGWPGITRILGNLDRPGIVMLSPPSAPLIRPEDPSAWRFINHFSFDGHVADLYKDTSLHLSFTQYEVPMNVSIGAVDAEVIMLESLISAYDRKTWVADLDVLGSLNDSKFFKRCRVPSCAPDSEEHLLPLQDVAAQIGKAAARRLVSIDSWDELLDPPEGLGINTIGVVRAGNNWQARLAATSVSVQRRHRTMVLPNVPTVPLYSVCGWKALRYIADFAEILIL